MVALASVVALSVVACGDRPEEDTAAEPPASSESSASESSAAPAEEVPGAADFKACMVSDSGGFDDKSFNQTSHDGLVSAKKKLGIQTGEVESQSDAEYQDNIAQLVRQKCDVIATVGFLLGQATEAAAKQYKKVDFAIVDFGYAKPPPNLRGRACGTGPPVSM